MKVHLIASKKSLEKDISVLRKIMSVIDKEGHTLARDWIETAYEDNLKTGHTAEDWSLIFNESLGTIAKTDVVIADATYENFGVGYMIATAVQQKKPVLLLRRDGVRESAFARGVEAGWVQHKVYTDETVNDIVMKFLRDNNITVKDMRFNFFIDRTIYNYLRWSALKTGKTKAEILRELVKNEIDKKE